LGVVVDVSFKVCYQGMLVILGVLTKRLLLALGNNTRQEYWYTDKGYLFSGLYGIFRCGIVIFKESPYSVALATKGNRKVAIVANMTFFIIILEFLLFKNVMWGKLRKYSVGEMISVSFCFI
jgi:hypothetical protein